MRVETPKSNEISKKDSLNISSEKSNFDSTRLPNSHNIITNTPSSSSFAKILDEARHEKKESSKTEADNKETVNKTDDDAKTESKNQAEENKEVEEQEQNSQGNQEDTENEEDCNPFVSVPVLSKDTHLTEIATPPARAILHVADLERIVSFVRSETTTTEKQILVSLKHSVLEGLQMRISLNENGNLKAEFLAQNEEIKKQLKKREKELFDILKQRSSKFTTLDILLS